jgi:hypothetical protein
MKVCPSSFPLYKTFNFDKAVDDIVATISVAHVSLWRACGGSLV